MVRSAKIGLFELPVTALSDYALCPLRFKFRHIDGHPGYQTGTGPHQDAMALGRLTHKALELGIDSVEELAKQKSQLPIAAVKEAFSLAQKFHLADAYAEQRQGNLTWEKAVSLRVGTLTLNGIVDLVGDNFVLDFKTDQSMHPDHHRFQLWAYSRAAGKPIAHLAYLRHDRLYSLTSAELSALDQEATALVKQLTSGDFSACHNSLSCNICPYAEFCDSRVI